MELQDIKKSYGPLAKKYKLPSWKALDDEFELLAMRDIAEVTHVLRFIRRRINDKLAYYTGILENLLQPNPGSLISLHETKFFTEDEFKVAIRLLWEMMYYDRYSLLLDTKSTEKEDAVFIAESFQQWMKLKDDLTKITKSLKDGWKKEMKGDTFQYIG